MNRQGAFAWYFIITLIFLSATCDKNPTNGSDDGTMPQVHIPWPSLADSPWPMYRHDPQGTGRSQYVGPQLGEVKWTLPFSYGVVSDEAITSFAIGSDSTLYFGSSYERPEGLSQTWVFYAVAPDGRVKWTFRDTTQITDQEMANAPLATADGTIIFGVPSSRGGGDIYALYPDGTLRWKFHTDGQPSELNTGLDGTLYFVGGLHLYALTPTGELKWQLTSSNEFGANLGAGIVISPNGQTLYASGYYGYQTLYAVSLDGQIKWTFYSGDSSVSMWRRPMVDNQGNVYISPSVGRSGSADTNATGFYSLTPGGEIRWKHGTSGLSFEHYTIDKSGFVYMISASDVLGQNTILSLDHTGHERWKVAVPSTHVSAPFISDKNATIYSLGSVAVAISGDTGETLWELPLPYNPRQCPAIGNDGTLYLGFSGGEGNKYVYAVH